jgi:hypothetical protein
MSHVERNLNLNHVWNEVSEGIDHIYRIQAMPPGDYILLYT